MSANMTVLNYQAFAGGVFYIICTIEVTAQEL